MQRREKTETRTLRFTLSLIKKLAKASERMGMTMNEFVVAVLEERVLVDPLIPAFHGMTLDSDIIESFLMSGKVDVLETALSEKAEKNVPLIFKLYESSDMPLDFWRYVVDILGKYCGWFYVEGNDATTHKWMMLRHSYGMKWSRCLRSYLMSAYSTISKDKLKIEISDQWVRIEF